VADAAAQVVVPVTEGDLVRLAPFRADVERKARVVAPPAECLDEATDKVFTSQAADALGISTPRQWVLPAAGGGEAPTEFPLVVKPSRSRVLGPEGDVRGATARPVADADSLAAARAEFAAIGLDTVAQVPVVGGGVLVSLLLREDGTPSLHFVHRRVREARPEGGPSACAISIPPEPRFVEPAMRLACALRPGAAPIQFEFRVPSDDRASGGPVLLDVNPRPWGTLGLALDCGINFYGLAARHAMGDPLPAPPPPYRAGVARHYLPFELRHAWAAVFDDPQKGYVGPWPGRTQAALDWMFSPGEGLVGKLDDPLPALADVARLIARGVRKI
jgi:predicted ATP-grasp superfamily ATP-dependent carboligase